MSPPHPLTSNYGILLRRLWHQRLQELAALDCKYTRKMYKRALTCPGYLLGDTRNSDSKCCNAAHFCPYCRARDAALSFDNLLTMRAEYDRKWSASTAWCVVRAGRKVEGEVGRLTGFNGLPRWCDKDGPRQLSLVLVNVENSPGLTSDMVVPDSSPGLARAVARVFAYPWWYLLGPAEAVRDYLDSGPPRKPARTGCLRSPRAVTAMADRTHHDCLAPRKPSLGPHAPCDTLEVMKSAVHGYDHESEILSRLHLPRTTRVVLSDCSNVSAAQALTRLPEPVPGAVNVLLLDDCGYVIAMPYDLVKHRVAAQIVCGKHTWIPLSHAFPAGRTAEPCTDAIWR
jgi:hypothetical protein